MYLICPMVNLSERVYHASNNIINKQEGGGLMRLYISMYVARPAHIESTVHTGF